MTVPDAPPVQSPDDAAGLDLSAVVTHLEVLGVTVETSGDLGVRLHGVTLDSRRVTPGDLYAALPGSRVHGADHWPQARDAGAVAVLTDPDGLARIGSGVPAVVVPPPPPVVGGVAAAGDRPPAAHL